MLMAANQRWYSKTRFVLQSQLEKIHFLRRRYYKPNTITIAFFFTYISSSELEVKWKVFFLLN